MWEMREMQKERQRETQSLYMRVNNDQNKIYTGNAQIIPTKNMQAQLKMLPLTIHRSKKDKIHRTFIQIPLILRPIFR
jgi:hypothetical protein